MSPTSFRQQSSHASCQPPHPLACKTGKNKKSKRLTAKCLGMLRTIDGEHLVILDPWALCQNPASMVVIPNFTTTVMTECEACQLS